MRPPTPTRRRTIARAALGSYLALLACLVLSPQPDDRRSFGWARRIIADLAAHGIPLTFPAVEAVGNVVVFVPFGLLLGAMLGLRRWWVVWLAGSLISAAIETIQLAVPGRRTTVQDWVLNGLGTAVGLAVLWLVVRLRALAGKDEGPGPAAAGPGPVEGV